ncbi:MAG TPA: glycoside hydrolase family 3 N-terminal domain-containing protein [Paracoccaceae bacterium]|nr:glycoside hydrolase family 3 N-terminal domain-containing protein [Paracoccaceae bacterium]
MTAPLTDQDLRRQPFNLDEAALAWVRETFAGLSLEAKLGQIMLPICRDLTDEALDAVLSYGVGGLHRMPGRSEEELRRSAAYAQRQSAIPLLMPTDIEFSEKSSIGAGSPFPNQMAVAAAGDPIHAERMGALAAREGGYLGFNVSWTPVADLALNFRSNVVNTRAFGSNTDQVISLTRAYHAGARANGFATCLKHWPGDGLDDRDQHFATTHNSLGMAEWRQSFGRIYADAISNGVQMIMAGHITLKAYTAELGAAGRSPAHMPATLNSDLDFNLLRGEFGFNGVIVSDATSMVGFSARGPRHDLVPLCIESGCDILLFPRDMAEDLGHLEAGLASGALSERRLDEAVLRILALKAAMGLHESRGALPPEASRRSRLATPEHRRWSEEVSAAAITLVKDTQGLLPLEPRRHRRILLAQLENRMSPSGPLPRLEIDRLLTEAGFEVTPFRPGDTIDPKRFDIGLYLMAEEGVSAKENLGPRWAELHGLFPRSMERLWDYLPTLCVSLGTPFLLFHMPECRTFVNAYSAVLPVQEAMVRALTGAIPFGGRSPVDAFCGLEEARL